MFSFQILSITDLNVGYLESIGKLEPSKPATKLSFRLSFFSQTFDRSENCPSIFSQEVDRKVDLQTRKLNEDLMWLQEALPAMHSAVNTPELAKNLSFMVLLLATKTADNTKEYANVEGNDTVL